MDNFFSFYILGIPGVLTYLIYKTIGDSATQSRSQLELIAITSLLWVPTVFLSILLFNTLHFLTEAILINIDVNYFRQFNIMKIITIENLIKNINNFIFILLFTLTTLVSSIAVSSLAPKLNEILINIINNIRVKKGYAKIVKKGSSAWKLFFIMNKDHQKSTINNEYSIVVQLSYLDNPKKLIYGSLKFISNDEKQQQFIIENENEWTNFVKEYQTKTNEEIPFADVFVDARNKLVIREIDQVKLNRKMEELNSEKKQNKSTKTTK